MNLQENYELLLALRKSPEDDRKAGPAPHHRGVRTRIPPHPRRLRIVYVRDILGVVKERKDPLEACNGFDWDDANADKNWERHRVTPEEAEEHREAGFDIPASEIPRPKL